MSKTKILVDLTHIRDDVHTGIGKVGIGLVRGFLSYSDFDLALLIWENQDQWYDVILGKRLKKILLPLSQQQYLDKKIQIKKVPTSIIDIIEKEQIKIVLTTRLSTKSYIFPPKMNQIGIVHDVQHIKILLNSHKYLRFIFHAILTAIYYNRVNNIVSISNHTKKDVKKFTGKSSVVIYNSVDFNQDSLGQGVVEEINNRKYILDVNTFWKYKNTERLIDAFNIIKDRIPHMLYLKGNPADINRAKELHRYILEKDISNRVIIDINNRTQNQMVYLYKHADLFVSPSLMEGFGLTPIEAISYKTPIIVSDIETLVEITDNKVATFNPYSVESIAQMMYNMIQSPPSIDELTSLCDYFKNKYSQKRQIENYSEYINKILRNYE